MTRQRTLRVPVSIRLRPEVLEALDETAEELVMSRNVLVERAVVTFLEALDLTDPA